MIGISRKRIAWRIDRSYKQAKRAITHARRVRRIGKTWQGKTFVVLKCRPVGFFSMFFQALVAYRICKKNDQTLIASFDTIPYYDKSMSATSWWCYYFEDNSHMISEKNADTLTEDDYVLANANKTQESLAWAATTMRRKLGYKLSIEILLKHEIRMKIAQYTEAYFDSNFVIGIHYRGTDKVIREAVRVEYDLVLGIVNRFAKEGIPFYLFIATDEEQFLQEFKETYGERVLSLDVKRSRSDAPIHMKSDGVSPYDLGLDALMDATILSKCDFLLRCDSNLSQASLFFNPKLDFINMSSLVMMYRDLRESINEKDLTAISRRILKAYNRKKA